MVNKGLFSTFFLCKKRYFGLNFVQKKLEKEPFFLVYCEKNMMFRTIRFNNNLLILSQNLPQANYAIPDKKPINRFSLISSLKYKRNFSLASSEKYVKLPEIRENQYKSDQKLKKINKEKQNFYEIYLVFSRVLYTF